MEPWSGPINSFSTRRKKCGASKPPTGQAGRKPDSRSHPELLSAFCGSTLSLVCIQTVNGLVQCNDTSLTTPWKLLDSAFAKDWEMGGEKGVSGWPRGLPLSQEFLGPSPGGYCQDASLPPMGHCPRAMLFFLQYRQENNSLKRISSINVIINLEKTPLLNKTNL